MIISDEEFRQIEHYLDVQVGEINGSFDVAFVFGTKSQEPVQKLLPLMKNGQVKFALLTGGLNKENQLVEAVQHADYLKANGIESERILIESRSVNTMENVSFGLEKLWSVMRYSEVKRILAMTKWYHSRRALMTLKKQLPKNVSVTNCSYETSQCTRENWSMNQQATWLVMKEWKTIPQYLQQGQLAEISEWL